MEGKLGPKEKLQIKQFFEHHDARQYVRQFIAGSFSEDAGFIPKQKISNTQVVQPDSTKKIETPLVTEPSLLIEVQKGAAFDEFYRSAVKTTLQISIDLFGKSYIFSDIKAEQCPDVSQTIISPLPDKLDAILSRKDPMRMCISTTSPDISFVGLGYYDWRKVITEGQTKASIELIGLQNEIVGVMHCTLKLIGLEENVNFQQYKQVYDLNVRQEQLDKIEKERQAAVKLKVWWRDLQNLINDKSLTIAANELGSNTATVFDSITPFYSRSLITPGHCLRFAYLMTPIIAPTNVSHLPVWAVVASKCGGEREKLNLLVSLLRGFGFRAFVVVASPKSFAVSYSSTITYFDVSNGKFSSSLPSKVETVKFMYNESSLYVNLNPTDPIQKLEWDIDNPLRWKILDAPNPPNITNKPAIREITDDDIDEVEIEMKVRAIIEQHRNSIGLYTRWNSDLSPIMLPIVDSYEREKITGQTLGVHQMASEAIRMSIKKYHAVRVALAVTNSTQPNAIFRSLLRTKKGMEILGAKDDDSSFVLLIKTTKYPNGLVAVWSLLAIDSVSSLAEQP